MNIKICDNCQGEGEVKKTGYRGEWGMAECGTCNGTGRVIVKDYSIKIPFTTDRMDYFEFDRDIMRQIREFKASVKLKKENG